MALELNNIGLFFAENYGSLQEAVNAMPLRGGTLQLSNKDYTLTSKLVIDKPITIQGMGAMDNDGGNFVTKIGTASATIDLIEFAAPNIRLKDVGLLNTAADVTAGSAIKVTSGSPVLSTNQYPARFSIDNVGIMGFYDNVHVVNSYLWDINRLISYKAKNYNIHIANDALPDGGDMNITNSWIYAYGRNTVAGIYHKNSGGLKCTNVKFNSSPGNTHRIVDIYYGLVTGSVLAQFSNCSFENFSNRAIFANGLHKLTVTGCDFESYTGTDKKYIEVVNANRVSIIGNLISLKQLENGINVTNSSHVTLLNTFRNDGTGANVIQSGNTNFLNLNP